MYKQYFGLKDQPFRLGPDPHYFFPAPLYRTVSISLLEGLANMLPIAILSGPAGVGKTLLLTHLVLQLEENYPIVLISNPRLHLEELLTSIQHHFNIRDEDNSINTKILALENFGQNSTQAGSRPVILLDEADNLLEENLITLFKLANPRVNGVSPFFIVLAVRDDTSKYLQLLSADTVKIYSLLPLLPEQIGPYIELRLHQAGYIGEHLFNSDAITRLVEISHGVPRLINRLCDAALLEASLSNQTHISSLLIDEISQGMWLSLGNESPSNDPSLAKGTESIFLSPKIEQVQEHIEPTIEIWKDNASVNNRTESHQNIQLPKEEKIYSLDSELPIEQSPELIWAIQDQNNKKFSTSLKKPKIINRKKLWVTAVAVSVVALTIGKLYLLRIDPSNSPLSSIDNFIKSIKNTTNQVKNLAMEKTEGFSEIARNTPNKATTVPFNEKPLETLANSKDEAQYSQEIKNTKPLEETIQPLQITQIEKEEKNNTIVKEIKTQNINEDSQNSETSSSELEESISKTPPENLGITTLLAQAKRQIDNLKLTTPEGDNAYQSYIEILKIAPNHPDAINGLQRIREYYKTWGLKAENRQDLSLAATYYKRALKIFPDDSNIHAALHRIQAQQKDKY